MTDFKTLKQGYQTELKCIGKNLQSFPWENHAAYASWCAQTYYYVCHSTRLLAVSAGRIPLANDEIYNRYIRHLSEEKGHEKLALRDLEKLGQSIQEFPEQANTAAFYQTQYYYIERVSPYALLGYILILEGLSAKYGPECYERTRAAHGKEATMFWKVHAEEDPGHIDQALAVIQKLDGDALGAILRNLQDSRVRYGELLDNAARAGVSASVKAA